MTGVTNRLIAQGATNDKLQRNLEGQIGNLTTLRKLVRGELVTGPYALEYDKSIGIISNPDSSDKQRTEAVQKMKAIEKKSDLAYSTEINTTLTAISDLQKKLGQAPMSMGGKSKGTYLGTE